jgi:hypothetical protein
MAIENLGNGGFAVTGEHVEVYRLLALRMALKLECSGLKSRGSPAKIVREILKANNYVAPQKKSSLLEHYELFLTRKGILKN